VCGQSSHDGLLWKQEAIKLVASTARQAPEFLADAPSGKETRTDAIMVEP
jgi:hypothetical protein